MARPTDDPKTVRMDLRLSPSLVDLIDEWRRHQKNIPPRSEAVRRLIYQGYVVDFETTLLLLDMAKRLCDIGEKGEDVIDRSEMERLRAAMREITQNVARVRETAQGDFKALFDSPPDPDK
jgi:hypothetical protein